MGLSKSESPAVELYPLEGLSSLLSLPLPSELDETESPRSSGLSVGDDHHVTNFPTIAIEDASEGLFGGVYGDIPNKKPRSHVMSMVDRSLCVSNKKQRHLPPYESICSLESVFSETGDSFKPWSCLTSSGSGLS